MERSFLQPRRVSLRQRRKIFESFFLATCAVRDGSVASYCHASPAHDAWLPSDSEYKQLRSAALGLYSSLQSIRAVRDGSTLLFSTLVKRVLKQYNTSAKKMQEGLQKVHKLGVK